MHRQTIFFFMVIALLAGCATLGQKPEPPTVTLAGLKIVKADFFEQRFALDLRLQNPNDFALPIRGLSYDLLLNGQSFANGVSASKVDVPALGEAVIRVESVTNLFSLYRQLRSLAESGEKGINYQLKGNVSLVNKNIKLPFDKRGEISLQ